MTKELANEILEYVANEIIHPISNVDIDLWEKTIEEPFNKLVEIVYSNVSEEKEKEKNIY